jgi:hypothetical protein
MTRPALRPLTAATAVVVAGAVGAVPATAAGVPPAPAAAVHWHAPRSAIGAPVPPKALPAAVGATTARGPGAPQTGLVARSVVVAGDGIVEGAPPGEHGSAGHASGTPGRARAPPQ